MSNFVLVSIEKLAVPYLLNSLTYDKHEHKNVWQFFSSLLLTLTQSHIKSFCCLIATLHIDGYTIEKLNVRLNDLTPTVVVIVIVNRSNLHPIYTNINNTSKNNRIPFGFCQSTGFLFCFVSVTLCTTLARLILLRTFFCMKNFKRTKDSAFVFELIMKIGMSLKLFFNNIHIQHVNRNRRK